MCVLKGGGGGGGRFFLMRKEVTHFVLIFVLVICKWNTKEECY